MRYKIIAIIGVLGILTMGVGASLYQTPAETRIHQHKEIDKNSLQDEEHSGSVFCTHLPLVSIKTKNEEDVVVITDEVGNRSAEAVESTIEIIDQEGRYNHLEDAITDKSKALVKVHGHSSKLFVKSSYRMRLVEEDGVKENHSIAFLGMPEHDDWILNGPILDKTLLRNYLTFNLAGSFMQNTPEVRFFELFINDEYQGVYVAMESVARDENRVPISKTKKNENFTSYIVRTDRPDSTKNQIDDFLTYTYRRSTNTRMEIVYPSTALLTPEKLEYIERDLNEFEKSLYSFDYTDEKYGYRAHIDVDTFVNYYIINEFTKNTDAGMFSTYFYKDVRGKLNIGPVWDFNNAYENYLEEAKGYRDFYLYNYPIYYMLMKDPEFTERIILRYKELRKGILAEENILNTIDETVDWLGDAITRNNEVWGWTFDTQQVDDSNKLYPDHRNPENYDEAIKDLKNFIQMRGAWLDKNIENLRQFSHPSKAKKFNH